MRAPGITYQFVREKDTAGPSFEVANRTLQESGSNNPIELVFNDLAKDKILVLTNVTVDANPGATQFVTDLLINGRTGTGTEFGIARATPVFNADESHSLNWSGSVYIIGNQAGEDSLRFRAFFNANANANAFTVSWSGIIIPRGNAALF